jgi:hypothetical protein
VYADHNIRRLTRRKGPHPPQPQHNQTKKPPHNRNLRFDDQAVEIQDAVELVRHHGNLQG